MSTLSGEDQRDESHNRPITASHISDLTKIYDNLMCSIAQVIPDIVTEYLVDHWRISVQKIINKANTSLPEIEEKDRYNLEKVFPKFLQMKDSFTICSEDLKELLYPENKNDLHIKLVKVFSDISRALENMMLSIENGELEKLQKENDVFHSKMDEIMKFRDEYLFSES